MDFQKPLAKYLKPLNKDSLNQLEKLFNHNLKTISYFQRDLTKFKILLAVMKNFNEDKLQTIEELIEDIPKSISSRAHKLNSITEATNLNYLIKAFYEKRLQTKLAFQLNEITCPLWVYGDFSISNSTDEWYLYY